MEFDLKLKDFELVLSLENEPAVVAAMAEAIRAALVARLRAGLGAMGPLNRPKDGGPPLRRTGQLLASVGTVVREARGTRKIGPVRAARAYELIGVVRPLGDRSNADNVRRQVEARKLTHKSKVRDALTRARITGEFDAYYVKRLASGEFKARGRRIRGAPDNASVMAILSRPPRDKRARNGHRGEYDVFRATPEYVRLGALAVRSVAEYKLRSVPR